MLAAALWLAGVLPAAGAPAQETRSTEAAPPRAAPADAAPQVPHPALDALPLPARQKVETLQAELERVVDEAPASPAVADGFTFLGRVLYAYELFDAAEECLTTALIRVPGNFEWRHLRGLVRAARGDHAGAVADFAAVTAAIEAVAPPLRLGDAYLALGQSAEARRAYEEALSRRRPTPAAEYGLGRAAALAGDAAEAARHFEAALSQQPSGTVAHAPLAEAYRLLGDEEKARRHLAERGEGPFSIPDPVAESVARIQELTAFETVREMAGRQSGFDAGELIDFVLGRFGYTPEPVFKLRSLLADLDRADSGADAAQRGRLRYALGALLVSQGRDELAQPELEAAVSLVPGLLDARLQLADLLARRHRFAAAVAGYDALLAVDPENAVALTHRAAARVNLASGDAAGREQAIRAARADLERALSLAGDGETAASAHDLLARLDLAAGRLFEAERHYRQALAAEPDHRGALGGLGGLLGHRGSYVEAAAIYGRLVAAAPDDAAARNGEAVALLLAGDYRTARERLGVHVAEMPRQGELKARLARLLAACPDRSLRDGQRAVTLAEQAFALDPSADNVETLAMAFAEAGDFEKALVWQRRLLAAGSGDDAARRRWQENLTLYESGRSCCAGQDETSGGDRP